MIKIRPVTNDKLHVGFVRCRSLDSRFAVLCPPEQTGRLSDINHDNMHQPVSDYLKNEKCETLE